RSDAGVRGDVPPLLRRAGSDAHLRGEESGADGRGVTELLGAALRSPLCIAGDVRAAVPRARRRLPGALQRRGGGAGYDVSGDDRRPGRGVFGGVWARGARAGGAAAGRRALTQVT